MKTVFVPMTEKNLHKIKKGIKTTTLRSDRAAEKIGLDIGEIAKTIFMKEEYYIKNIGKLTIMEAGGKEKMWKSEGFLEESPIFQSTIEWLNGKGKLYVFVFSKKIEDLLEDNNK